MAEAREYIVNAKAKVAKYISENPTNVGNGTQPSDVLSALTNAERSVQAIEYEQKP